MKGILWFYFLSWAALSYGSEPRLGVLKGTVKAEKQSLSAVTLTLKNRVFERTVTVDGRFAIQKLPAGNYQLTAASPGFETRVLTIAIEAGKTTTLGLELKPAPLELRHVAVAPSTFSLLSQEFKSGAYLDRETISNTPHFGDDPFRALGVLPGASGNDFGSAFTIRGGEYREVLVTLDGMELINPFHLKDFTGVFSYFDPEVLGGMNLSTGGFDARYGNAMSAVMEMHSVEPSLNRSAVTLSFGNVGFRSEGTFAEGLGSYLFTARRGYLDILLGFTEDEEEQEESDISYFDSYGKVQYLLDDRNALTLSYLLAGDDFLEKETEDGEVEDADANYDDLYTWVNWRANWTGNLSSETVAYFSDLSQNRKATSRDVFEGYDLLDNRSLRHVGLKQNWELTAGEGHFWRWGFDFRDVKANYQYQSELFGNFLDIPQSENIAASLNPEGEEFSTYLTYRSRLRKNLIAELGLRYDKQTLLDDSQVSPRFNLSYETETMGTFRFAYGIYHQAERAHDLQVADGSTQFSSPERASHWLLGYNYRLARGLDLRVEGYYKDLQNLRTRYENLTRSLVLYGGTGADRVALPVTQGFVQGIEVVLKQDLGRKFSWFMNYAWSRAEDKTAAGVTIPRQWEQEHSFNVNANYRPGSKWNFNGAWTYHSGWRTTPLSLEQRQTPMGPMFHIVAGDFFSERFPAYHRLDLRINRNVYLNHRRSFEIYLDIRNLYNRKNLRGFEGFQVIADEGGMATLISEREDWLPVLPTFGLTWKF